MRILYLGDIVGSKTIKALDIAIKQIKSEYKVNLVFANAENTTMGMGLSLEDYKALKKIGIVAMSMGNHTFSKSEIFDYIDDASICRPANLNTNYGKGYLLIKYNDKTICLVNLMGRVFNDIALDCPFKTMDNILATVKADYYIVDFHAEATSEKKAFFYEYQGKVSAIVGTHTHVQTSDEEVYNNTLYITDLGMCGIKESILGQDIPTIILRFRSGVYKKASIPTSNEYMINGVILDLDNGKNNITRINLRIKL